MEGDVIMAPSPGKLRPRDYHVKDITRKGHDFIKLVREDTVSRRAKEHFKSKAVPWTADLIMEFLKSHVRAALGF